MIRETLPDLRLGPIDPDWVTRYAAASLDDNPIHTDPEAARAVGLDGTVVQGMLLMGQFEALLAAWRPDWRIASLEAKFLRAVPVGEGAHVTARVLRAEEEGRTVAVRLTVRTQAGGIACIGDARLEAP